MRILLAALLSIISIPAFADGFFFKPYVGADYDYVSIDYKSIPGTIYNYGDFYSNSFNGGNLHAGIRFHEYFGIEGGYLDTFAGKKTSSLGTTSSFDFRGEYLDAMGYLPLGKSKVELIALAGGTHIDGGNSITISGTTYSASNSKTFPEFGGGIEYWITDNLNVRSLVRYVDVSQPSISDAVRASIGINWQF